MRNIVLVLAALSLVYGAAAIDGNPVEWAGDPPALELRRAGSPSGVLEAHGYLRYDCAENILAVYFEPVPGVSVLVDPEEAWVKINGSKVVDDQSGDDGVAPDFAYVNSDGTYADGWEANLPLSPGTYSIAVHSNVLGDGVPGDGETAGGGENELVIDCTPTAVEMVSFTATYERFRVRLDWETGSELDLVSFNVQRQGWFGWTQVNDSLIPAQSPGQPFGNQYTFYHRAFWRQCYRLEVVEVGEVSYTDEVCAAFSWRW